MKPPRGFTLFEILIAMAISVTLLGVLFSIYTLSAKSLSAGQARAELTQTSRSIMERITRDIRETKNVVSGLPPGALDPLNPPLEELMLEDGHSETLQYIRYYRDGGDLYRQIRQYYFPEEPQIMVPHNAEDEFGNEPEISIIENHLVGQYISEIIFYGQNPVSLKLTLEKETIIHETRTALYGRNL